MKSMVYGHPLALKWPRWQAKFMSRTMRWFAHGYHRPKKR
jgi:hypothetical protein